MTPNSIHHRVRVEPVAGLRPELAARLAPPEQPPVESAQCPRQADPRPPHRRRRLNQEKLVRDYLSGMFSYQELAKRHGVSPGQVGRLIRGERRPRIAEMIEQAVDSQRWQARRRIARLVEQAIEALAKALAGDAKPTTLSAAREVLNRVLKESPRPQPKGLYPRSLEALRTWPRPPTPPKRFRYDYSLVPPDLLDVKGEDLP